MNLDFESDQFLKLLTDALRAGPGSPSWHEAVLRLQAGDGGAGVSEYQMLCDARAHLESGKEYRSVRPGPGFTRKVMTALDTQTQRGGSGFPTTNIIAVIAGLLIVGALVTAGIYLIPHEPISTADSAAIDRLASTLLGNPVTSITFDKSSPAGWNAVGKLPLEYKNEMHVGKLDGSSTSTLPGTLGGALVYSSPLPADAPFAIEAVIHVGRSTEDLLPEVVVSDQSDFGNDTATTSHELITLVQGGQARVILPDGKLEGQAAVGKGNVTVRVTVDATSAIVDVDGKRLWAGAHGLAGDQPKYVAVRLLRRAGDRQDQPAFVSVRVLK